MKKLFFGLLLLPFLAFIHRSTMRPSTGVVEVRSGQWPISLEKDVDTPGTYSLIFRNQEYMTANVMDTLNFHDLGQLKYFEQALSVLATGHNGDIAKFKDYSVKRAEKKFEGVWYILTLKWSSTSFQQQEADIMRKTIKSLR